MLLPDAMIGEEALFEDVNCVLNQGEVPGLWEQDELEMIYGRMGQVLADEQQLLEEQVQAEEAAAAAAGDLEPLDEDEDEDGEGAFAKAAARNDLYATFVERLRENLHMLLATSPVGATLRRRLRTFPSLLSCCSIDWFEQWPRAALQSVGTRLLRLVCLPSTIPAPKIPGAPSAPNSGAGLRSLGTGSASGAVTGTGIGIEDDEYSLQRAETLPPFAQGLGSAADINDRLRHVLVDACVAIHVRAADTAARLRGESSGGSDIATGSRAKRVYVTPRAFLDLV